MYKEELILTGKSRCPLALTNDFDDTFNLIDELLQCVSAKEFCNVANKYAKYGKWIVDIDKSTETRLIHKDTLGNVRYLIATKTVDVNLSSISDNDLIMELINRGYKVAK